MDDERTPRASEFMLREDPASDLPESSGSGSFAPSPLSVSTAPTNASSIELILGDYKVFNPPRTAVTTPATPDSLPDNYFEPTSEELKAAWQSQSRLVEKYTNAPLKTQAIRDREAKEKAARWPKTRIRIKFPNQLMLERTFDSKEKIRAVYAFVRESLTDEAKPHKFILYETPPRRELKVSDPAVKTLSLVELRLAPAAMLHLSFLDEEMNLSNQNPPLLPEILARAEDLPPPPTFEDPATSAPKAKSSGNKLGGSSTSSGEKKLPKWLKLSK